MNSTAGLGLRVGNLKHQSSMHIQVVTRCHRQVIKIVKSAVLMTQRLVVTVYLLRNVEESLLSKVEASAHTILVLTLS